MNNIKLVIFAISVSIILQACSPADKENPGSEYMPDMGHSLAVESTTYNYYYYNTWNNESTLTLGELINRPKIGVEGTVPRGYAGDFLGSDATVEVIRGNDEERPSPRYPVNGHVPYFYEDTDSARLLATAEIIDNPFPITADGLARGKELYNIFCGICHGEKANGLGYLYDNEANPNAKYLAAPANLINEEFSAASNGRFYHAIIYGKNVMGGYSDKISYEERWQVIHYIRSLQAKEAGATYNEDENTYNASFGVPAAAMTSNMNQTAMMFVEEETTTDGHGEDAHGATGEHHTDENHDTESHDY